MRLNAKTLAHAPKGRLLVTTYFGCPVDGSWRTNTAKRLQASLTGTCLYALARSRHRMLHAAWDLKSRWTVPFMREPSSKGSEKFWASWLQSLEIRKAIEATKPMSCKASLSTAVYAEFTQDSLRSSMTRGLPFWIITKRLLHTKLSQPSNCWTSSTLENGPSRNPCSHSFMVVSHRTLPKSGSFSWTFREHIFWLALTEDWRSNSGVVVARTTFSPNNGDLDAWPTRSTPCSRSHTSMSWKPCSFKRCWKRMMLLPLSTTRAWGDNKAWSLASSNLSSYRSWVNLFDCSNLLLAKFWTPPHSMLKILILRTSGTRFSTSNGCVKVLANLTNCSGVW